jgi:hypothetical protein
VHTRVQLTAVCATNCTRSAEPDRDLRGRCRSARREFSPPAAQCPTVRRDDSLRAALGAQGARAASRRPECVELLPDRRARPPRPGAGGRVSGPRRRAMGYRRDADLGPRRDRSRSAPAGVTTEWPAVRVHARGGGGGLPAGQCPVGRLCLTQRRELRGRLHGLAHQLAERALMRAACGRRGEHVFGRLRVGSDGMWTSRNRVAHRVFIWLCAAQFDRNLLQAILQFGEIGRARRRGQERLAAHAAPRTTVPTTSQVT